MKNQDQVVFGPSPTDGTTDAAAHSVQNSAPVNTRTTESMATKSSVPRATTAESSPKTSRYRAPALEKGLDVIELLAAEKSPLNLSAISQRLGRSSGELFRMLQVLE